MAGAEDREAVSREGVDLASKAVQSTPDDPETLGVAAFAFGYFSSQDIDAAKALIDRSVALSPSRAHSWLVSGWLRLKSARTAANAYVGDRCRPFSESPVR